MSSFAFSPSGWSGPSTSAYPQFATETDSTMPAYPEADPSFAFCPPASPRRSSSDSYFSDAVHHLPHQASSSPSAGSSSASSSSAPATPVRDVLPSPLSDVTPTTAVAVADAAAPLGSGWVSSTPFLPATASVAERCNETGYFLTLSSEVDKKLRTVQACDACRARKAKCDGLKDSCTRCLQRGVCCAYTTGPRRPTVKLAKRPSLTPSRSGSVSSASSSSASVPLASHVKLQSVTSASKARKPSKIARRSSSDSVASASEPVIVDASAYSDDQASHSGELAYGWSNDGLAAPFEMSYAPSQPMPVQTQYYPTASAAHYRRTSLQHAPTPYATPYARQRAGSHQVSASVGYFETPSHHYAYSTPRPNQSVLVQRRQSSAYTAAAPYPTPELAADDDFFYARPVSANVYQTPVAPRRSSAPVMLGHPTPYTPAAAAYQPAHHEAAFEPFAQPEAQQVAYDQQPAWESQAVWGEAVY